MTSYQEKKRERRIRDYRRMVQRALVVFRNGRLSVPPNPFSKYSCDTWEELIADRSLLASVYANNLKRCSCCWCGNQRRHYRSRTCQEQKARLEEIEQLAEMGFLDARGGNRGRFSSGEMELTRFPGHCATFVAKGVRDAEQTSCLPA